MNIIIYYIVLNSSIVDVVLLCDTVGRISGQLLTRRPQVQTPAWSMVDVFGDLHCTKLSLDRGIKLLV